MQKCCRCKAGKKWVCGPRDAANISESTGSTRLNLISHRRSLTSHCDSVNIQLDPGWLSCLRYHLYNCTNGRARKSKSEMCATNLSTHLALQPVNFRQHTHIYQLQVLSSQNQTSWLLLWSSCDNSGSVTQIMDSCFHLLASFTLYISLPACTLCCERNKLHLGTNHLLLKE